jgi:glycogen operon protein
MVKAFHREGIKVFLDVVFNHTGEGLLYRTTEDGDSRCDDHKQLPDSAALLSFRGLDNATYYALRSCPALDGGRPNQRYLDNSACGPSLNVMEPIVREFIIDSLHYWDDEMGVDPAGEHGRRLAPSFRYHAGGRGPDRRALGRRDRQLPGGVP